MRRGGGQLWLRVVVVMVVLSWASPTRADLWYEHYDKAERAIAEERWGDALNEANQAIQKRSASSPSARTYGVNFVEYFPYLKLGIAYYHLGQPDAALQAFDTEQQLGAIAQSSTQGALLEDYRGRIEQDRQQIAAATEQRRRELVTTSLDAARGLEQEGRLDEAVAEVGKALAVAPDDPDATALVARLRAALQAEEETQALERRVADLVQRGRGRLDAGEYQQAASLLDQAQSLQPSDEVAQLLGDAQQRLADQVAAERSDAERRELIASSLRQAAAQERAGDLPTALETLQTVLALEPQNSEARTLQSRLLTAQAEAERTREQQSTLGQLIQQARTRLDQADVFGVISLANRALALEPSNQEALDLIASAYLAVNAQFLPGENPTPLLTFVDRRVAIGANDLVEEVTSPDFVLTGTAIDTDEFDVRFFDENGEPIEGATRIRNVGNTHIAEFSVRRSLPRGTSSITVVARDAAMGMSRDEYRVTYAVPLWKSPWPYAGALTLLAVALAGALGYRRQQRSRLRKRRFNPYVAGAPVLLDEQFFGRQRLLHRVLDRLHNNSILLYGERRIGKTSFQHRLKRHLQTLNDPKFKFFPVFVDLQGTPQERFFATIADELFEELGPALGGLERTPGPPDTYTYREFVRDVKRAVDHLTQHNEKKTKIVLLMDEVDELNAYDPRVNQKLRSLFMRSFADHLVAVVSGVGIKKRWESEGSPWYNFFEEIQVQPFREDDARKLIEAPLQGVFRLGPGVTERIIERAEFRPYRIQKLCMALVDRLYEQGRRTATAADVDAVCEPVLAPLSESDPAQDRAAVREPVET